MGKDRTYPVKVDVIRKLMEDRNISVSELAKTTRLDRKSIHNILAKKSQPTERSLALIATALGVKWRTLVEGYDGELQDLEGGGGLAVKTTITMILDIRTKGILNDGQKDTRAEKAKELLMNKIRGRIHSADEIRISVLRDEDEN